MWAECRNGKRAPGDGAEESCGHEKASRSPALSQEREKGRARAFVRGESLGQPPKKINGWLKSQGLSLRSDSRLTLGALAPAHQTLPPCTRCAWLTF